eukprot:Lithocolla_globosa_v1_NODE_43_length_8091_cov_73.466584.p4 type:complete len:135 gc:universal NODE_43_length_8091_cov_73.466584:6131-5727(-)
MPIFKKLGMMHISDLYKYRISLLAHQYLNIDTKFQIQKITPIKDKHNHHTRASIHFKIFKQRYRTKSFGMQTISNKLSVAWNDLPISLTIIKSTRAFKKQLRQYILNNPTQYKQSSKPTNLAVSNRGSTPDHHS